MNWKATLPNLMTAMRLFLVPVIMWQIFAASHYAAETAMLLAFWLFLLASFTDFLDGYLARQWQVTSLFGAAADHIADKLLVVGTLMALVEGGFVLGPAILAAYAIVFREIIISGLRESLAGRDVRLPVNMFGKSKTMLQMTAIGVLLLSHSHTINLPIMIMIGEGLLILASLVTIVSGLSYIRGAMQAVK